MKYYAVRKGKQTGIFTTWDACKQSVMGYSGAVYKSFPTKEEANAFLEGGVKPKQNPPQIIAYVDGSYNISTREYGYGIVILEGGQEIWKNYGKGNNEEDALMRNVAGEIMGCMKAVEYGIQHGYTGIAIYYDYEGIEKWACGLWKANKTGTKHYVETMKEYEKQISIHFVKVAAHSDDFYNDMADRLAKTSVGVK